MKNKARFLSLVAMCAMALFLSMWAVALAQEDDTTTTTTTAAGGSTTTTAAGGSTTTTGGETTTSSESTTTTTAIPIVTIASPVTGAVPTFLSVAEGRFAWTGIVPGGYSTMYVYDLATATNVEISTSSPGPYYNPSADGPWVVFQGGRAGAYDDIYAYDTGNGLVKRVTFNTDPGDGEDWNPRIQSGRIVWEKHTVSAGKTGIYLYDLNGGTGTTATLLLSGGAYHDPDIWGDYVVCVKDAETGNGSEIVLYNLKTKLVKSIASSDSSNERPRIDSGHVVWSSGEILQDYWYPWSSYEIQLYDIAKDSTTALTDNSSGNFNPSIKGGIVAWEQREPSRIIALDMSNGDTYEFSVAGETVKSPDTDGDLIAFFGSKGLYYVRLFTSEYAPFPDVPTTSPYSKAIATMTMLRIIEGYYDGRFGLSDLVTRQQFAKMLVLTMAQWNSAIFTPSFSDNYSFADSAAIARTEGELYPYYYVAKAALTGLTQGYPDNTFRPLNNISRQQVITMLVRAGRQVLATPPAGWQGVLSYVDPIHGENRRIAEYNGLVNGIVAPQNSLAYWRMDQATTRGEVAQMLYNLLGKLKPELLK